jgi:hypothetical protein
MPNTFTLIGSYTAGSGGATTVTFSSIPQTYTDLLLKLSVRGDSNSYREVWINPNGSTSNGAGKMLFGSGSSTAATSTTARFEVSDWSTPPLATAGIFGSADAYITNYATSKYKRMSSDTVTENALTQAYISLQSSLWSDTAAITSLDIVLAVGAKFEQYSSFSLYGIKNS